MAELNEPLYEIIAEKLQKDPHVDQAQLENYVQTKIAGDSRLVEVLGKTLVQINFGDTTAFQTLVEGGIAYIGPQVHVEDAKLKVLLEHLLQRLRPIGVPHNLPRSGAVEFVGRDLDLKQLHKALQKGEHLAITSINGMGGVGKTELALQYAQYHRQQGSYPGGICWLRAREQDIAIQIVSFARAIFGLNLPDGLELAEQVTYCWRNWPEGRWPEGRVLVVVDDVTDYGEVIASLPPQEPRFCVLLTTRLKLWQSIRSFQIEVLSEEASLKLLESLIGTERILSEEETAKELCQWLGYLPLGLELVGRYLARKPDLSLIKMQERLEAKRLAARALCQRQEDMTSAHEGVAAAFELSWQELGEAEQQLAYLVSLFALAPIPWTLVEQCLEREDEEDQEEWREGLVNRSLLQRVGKGTYQLHQLIREFFRAKLTNWEEADDLKRCFCRVMAQVAHQLPQTPTRNQIIAIGPAIPHMAEVVTALQDGLSDEDFVWPFDGLGRFYAGQGAYVQAVPWREECLSVVRDRFGELHPKVAFSLNNLAWLYYVQGCYSEAEPLYVEALRINKRSLGEEHSDVAVILNNLAGLYRFQGRYNEAESLYQKTLQMRRRLLGKEHPDVAVSLNDLAGLYESQGRYSEAESLYREALQMNKQLLSEENLFVATSLNNLAGLYDSQGRYSEAELLYREALEMDKRLLGDEHPSVATSLNNLAGLYRSQGRYSEAELFYREALEMRRRLLSDEHPDVATSLSGLAGLYGSQGRYGEAELLCRQALEMRQRLLGDEHPDVVVSLNDLAVLCYSRGRYNEAEFLYRKALEMPKQLLGELHPDVVTSLNNLARLYDSQGRYSEAEWKRNRLL